MEYLEIKFTLPEDFRDIIIAELSGNGFDTFLETDEGFNAYIDRSDPDLSVIDEVIARYKDLCEIYYKTTIFPDKNWNEEWEKSFEPIVIAEKCLIRAPFHKVDQKFSLEILINPKLAFGTGHHATTYLMIEEMMKHDIRGKDVIDFGTGTGILAIAARKLGASVVWATDINEWSINNSKENFGLNSCEDIKLMAGQIADLRIKSTFDMVLANINRNVLIEEIPSYVDLMREDANMLLSGFFEEDEPLIAESARNCSLKVLTRSVRNNWVLLVCGR